MSFAPDEIAGLRDVGVGLFGTAHACVGVYHHVELVAIFSRTFFPSMWMLSIESVFITSPSTPSPVSKVWLASATSAK